MCVIVKTPINVTWSFLGSARTKEIVLDVPDNATGDAPLIILLHGTSGDINDMSDPRVRPGFNYERILPGTRVDRPPARPYPNAGFWSLGADELVGVTGWAPFLAAAGFPTINYSQINPRELLVEPLRELRAILDAIDIDTDGKFHAVRNRQIILIGHSRGGILARMILVELAAAGAPILARISTCITLHSPNQGSTLANTALILASIVASWRVTGVPVVPPELQGIALQALDGVISYIVEQAGAPAYADFAVGSPTLLGLAVAEPVPGIMYFTFGGTRPVFLNLRGWAFTPESAIPLFTFPPSWHWSTVYVPLMPLPPPPPLWPFVGVPVLPSPELLEGGDVLTHSLSTQLPFAVHRNNHINHAEALWDDDLKAQVLAILGSPHHTGDADDDEDPTPWLSLLLLRRRLITGT